MQATQSFRIEKDLLGTQPVSNLAYYGIQTQRAIENFDLNNKKIKNFPLFIKSLSKVKLACAQANHRLGQLSDEKLQAIEYACAQLDSGKYLDQFPLDMIQGGAGTSTNMNINEVIANIGLEFLGHAKGEYQYLHPNNDINMSQSTNDAYPTAIKVALLYMLDECYPAVEQLIQAFQRKATEFAQIKKMGRTQLQDAVPMTLGQEFSAFAVTLEKDLALLKTVARQGLYSVNLGGTAIGTGICASKEYQDRVVQHLAEQTQFPMTPASDLIEATSDMGEFVLLSGLLKRTATKLGKIANDLRLLSSGPRTGFAEIQLEPRQPGSSIMPGKVNPVIPEAVNLTSFQIIANDLAVTLSAEAGQLQLNAMEPLIAYKLFESLELLRSASQMFNEKCIQGIRANAARCEDLLNHSIGIVTAFNPYLGYETTTRIARTAYETGQSIVELIQQENLMSAEMIQAVLNEQSAI